MSNRSLLLAALIAFSSQMALINCRRGFGPGEQDWGFVDARAGTHMFYWLYYTTAHVRHYTERPLVLWLEGGPGASATGFSNFYELGPLDIEGKPRDYNWMQHVNVLLIDSPVGSGFSYVDNVTQLPSNNEQVAKDLLNTLRGFYDKHPEFKTVPLHIFTQSYGAKTVPYFAQELKKAIASNAIAANFKSIVLGSPWVSPIDTTLSWAPQLYYAGIIDTNSYRNISAAAEKCADLVRAEKWQEANVQVGQVFEEAMKAAPSLNAYNILQPVRNDSNFNETVFEQNLNMFMQNTVKKALKITENVSFGALRSEVEKKLADENMKPVVHIVNDLLRNTDLSIVVYSAQGDLICNTAGSLAWIDKLNWSDVAEYKKAQRQKLVINGTVEGYVKSAGHFQNYWILRSGHTVPNESPAVMEHILRSVTKFA